MANYLQLCQWTKPGIVILLHNIILCPLKILQNNFKFKYTIYTCILIDFQFLTCMKTSLSKQREAGPLGSGRPLFGSPVIIYWDIWALDLDYLHGLSSSAEQTVISQDSDFTFYFNFKSKIIWFVGIDHM